MPRKTKQQTINLRERIHEDARHAIAMLAADKIGNHAEPNEESKAEARWLARNRDSLARHVFEQLLKHYTIRDRRR